MRGAGDVRFTKVAADSILCTIMASMKNLDPYFRVYLLYDNMHNN